MLDKLTSASRTDISVPTEVIFEEINPDGLFALDDGSVAAWGAECGSHRSIVVYDSPITAETVLSAEVQEEAEEEAGAHD